MKLLPVTLIFIVNTCSAQMDSSGLDYCMKVNGLRALLLYQSTAIDEFPVWNETSDTIYFNEMGTWRGCGISEVKIEGGKLLPDRARDEQFKEVKADEIQQYISDTKSSAFYLEVSESRDINIEKEGFKYFVYEKGDSGKFLLWESNGVCHSLSLSPDKKFAAFISELEGGYYC